jgi:hypothetical protein
MNQIFEMINNIEEQERMKANDQNINNSIETQTEKKKRGRPRVEWRHREDGTVDNKPNDPHYAKKYWLANYKKPFTCENCGKTLTCSGSSILRHKQTMHCKLAKFIKLESN